LQGDDAAVLIGDQSQVERALALLDPTYAEGEPPSETTAPVDG
jgi:hypothetical protein